MEVCVLETTAAHAQMVGPDSRVRGLNASLHVFMASALLLPRSVSVMKAGEANTATKYKVLCSDNSGNLLHHSIVTCIHIRTAVCNPPCQNGGTCIVSGFCVCPTDWQGPLCGYPRHY